MARALCNECDEKTTRRGHWKCIECKNSFPKSDFTEWLRGRKSQANNGTARCNACKLRQDVLFKAQHKESIDLVKKK